MAFTKMTLSELKQISSDKLDDAKLLLLNQRYAASYYICGYALELILKYRIAKQLNWSAIDISDHKFLKIHDVETLVKYTGVFDKILVMPQWNTCRQWKSEMRYLDATSVSETQANNMVVSTEVLIKWLLAN